MGESTDTVLDVPKQLPQINKITLDHPWRWIESGWNDFKLAPVTSIVYGISVTIASYLITLLTLYGGMLFFVLPLIAGFFLLAPILAVGLYEISRTLSTGGEPSLSSVVRSVSRNSYNLAAMGLILMMAFLIWMLVANLVFALFYSGITPTMDNFVADLFLSGDHPMFLFAGVISGSIVSLAVFSISVISTPLLLDRDIDLISALGVSVKSVIRNPGPLLLWASLIVMFIGIGMVTFYIGLIFFMPIIGYASWHAYRDLVPVQDE